MVRSIWLRRAGPGLVALGAVAMLASTTLGAPERPWDPPACVDVRGGSDQAAGVGHGTIPVASGRAPWFRLDLVLDRDGALTGQRLLVGRTGSPARRTLVLPPESFAAGPFGDVVLVGTDDGTRSRVVALDVLAGCASELAGSTDVIRRATISPDGRSLVEFRVDRRTRADLGTWRGSLDGLVQATRILPPIDADPRFGRTWSTEFIWADDGSLAVQSCGEQSCRSRVLDPTWRPTATLAESDLGATLGLADGRLVSYLACRGLPCPIVATDLATGRRQVLVADAGTAVVTPTDEGPRLVHMLDLGHGPILQSLALDGSRRVDLGTVPPGYDLHATPSRAAAGVPVPPGWVLLAPDGRLPADGADPAPILRQVLDGRSAALEEVLR